MGLFLRTGQKQGFWRKIPYKKHLKEQLGTSKKLKESYPEVKKKIIE